MDIARTLKSAAYVYISDNEYNKIELLHDTFEKWKDSDYGKIVLKADGKEWTKLKAELPQDQFVLVKDNGLTEIASGSETCIGLMPMRKSECPKIIKKLQLLK